MLEHIGFPRRRDEEYFTKWKAGLQTLAQAPNITCKISGVAMTDPHFTAESLRRWIDTPLEVFGADRCVLGSNWPVDRLFSSYDVIMDIYRERLNHLDEADRIKVLSGNAARLYHL